MPTLLTLAGLHVKIPDGIDGIDFTQTLEAKPQKDRDFLYREFPGYGGQQAVWMGPWKAVRQNLNRPPAGAAAKKKAANKKAVPAGPVVIRTELYNLETDPTESKDVASENPEIVARMEALMKQQHVPSEVFPMRALDLAR